MEEKLGDGNETSYLPHPKQEHPFDDIGLCFSNVMFGSNHVFGFIKFLIDFFLQNFPTNYVVELRILNMQKSITNPLCRNIVLNPSSLIYNPT